MEWKGNHFILRTKNLEYDARGNETKIIFICFQMSNIFTTCSFFLLPTLNKLMIIIKKLVKGAKVVNQR